MARTYKRDRSGRFSSTGTTGRTASAGRSKPKVLAGGTLAARTSLRKSRAKLAENNTSSQRGAVTRASRRLAEKKQTERVKISGLRKASGTVRKPRSLQPGTITARSKNRSTAKPAVKPAGGGGGGRKRNAAAERAKEMANRSGMAPGKRFTHGRDVRTESLRELRSAVRQNMRSIGITSRKEFLMQALAAGISKPNANGMAEGRMPKTRGDWEKMYKSFIGMPQSNRNNRQRAGIVNGIDIHRDFRPWAVFGLNPKSATREDINRAFRTVSKTVHPDVGGRRRDFERVKKMRDSLLAFTPEPKKKGGSGGRKGGSKSRKGRSSTAASRSGVSRPQLPGGS